MVVREASRVLTQLCTRHNVVAIGESSPRGRRATGTASGPGGAGPGPGSATRPSPRSAADVPRTPRGGGRPTRRGSS